MVLMLVEELVLAGEIGRSAAHEDVAIAALRQQVGQAHRVLQEGTERLALRVAVEDGHAFQWHAALRRHDCGDGPAGARHLLIVGETGAVQGGERRQQIAAEGGFVGVVLLQTFDIDQHQIPRLLRRHRHRRRMHVVGAEIIRPEIG